MHGDAWRWWLLYAALAGLGWLIYDEIWRQR
jgi:hypothetical protein